VVGVLYRCYIGDYQLFDYREGPMHSILTFDGSRVRFPPPPLLLKLKSNDRSVSMMISSRLKKGVEPTTESRMFQIHVYLVQLISVMTFRVLPQFSQANIGNVIVFLSSA